MHLLRADVQHSRGACGPATSRLHQHNHSLICQSSKIQVVLFEFEACCPAWVPPLPPFQSWPFGAQNPIKRLLKPKNSVPANHNGNGALLETSLPSAQWVKFFLSFAILLHSPGHIMAGRIWDATVFIWQACSSPSRANRRALFEIIEPTTILHVIRSSISRASQRMMFSCVDAVHQIGESLAAIPCAFLHTVRISCWLLTGHQASLQWDDAQWDPSRVNPTLLMGLLPIVICSRSKPPLVH